MDADFLTLWQLFEAARRREGPAPRVRRPARDATVWGEYRVVGPLAEEGEEDWLLCWPARPPAVPHAVRRFAPGLRLPVGRTREVGQAYQDTLFRIIGGPRGPSAIDRAGARCLESVAAIGSHEGRAYVASVHWVGASLEAVGPAIDRLAGASLLRLGLFVIGARVLALLHHRCHLTHGRLSAAAIRLQPGDGYPPMLLAQSYPIGARGDGTVGELALGSSFSACADDRARLAVACLLPSAAQPDATRMLGTTRKLGGARKLGATGASGPARLVLRDLLVERVPSALGVDLGRYLLGDQPVSAGALAAVEAFVAEALEPAVARELWRAVLDAVAAEQGVLLE